MEIVVASHNLHKVREFRDMLKPLKHIEVLTLSHFSNYALPKESGSTFEENATLKATHAAHSLNKWVLADDSGLIVPALKGKPGVFSSRYSGEKATDIDNRKKLLLEMKNLQDFERSAYFECCLAIANSKGLVKCVTGRCEGYILNSERGNNGFGYDSLFVKNDYDKSFAEIDETTKNRISHRRKTFEKLLVFLETLV